MVLWSIGALITLAVAHDPMAGQLDAVVVVALPIPIARPGPGDARFCFELSPTLGTAHTVVEHEGIELVCASEPDHTRLCVTIAAGADWPARLARLTCTGNEHTLRASFVPGHDPREDPDDGVEVVRLRGPEALRRDHDVRFLVPDWPDAPGALRGGPDARGGRCEVRDGQLHLSFREPVRSRIRCELAAPLSREVVIRLRRRRRA